MPIDLLALLGPLGCPGASHLFRDGLGRTLASAGMAWAEPNGNDGNHHGDAKNPDKGVHAGGGGGGKIGNQGKDSVGGLGRECPAFSC